VKQRSLRCPNLSRAVTNTCIMFEQKVMKQSGFFAGAFLACSLFAGAAFANGRYPSAQLLLLDPSDPNRLWLRATYGLLTSADRGCTWYRICEAAPDYLGTEDPMFGVMADGTVIGATFRGMPTTRDHGCSWSKQTGVRGYVVDLAVQPSDARRAIAMVSSGMPSGGFLNQIWRTTDAAMNWEKLGQVGTVPSAGDLDPKLLLLTLDAAPSLPSRIYVTANRTTESDASALISQGVLLRSDDDGVTWTERPITGAAGGFDPYLSVIHPTDPNRLYVRLRGPNSSPDFVDNRVVYSADGGATWQQIFQSRADILGFALSPDGSRLLLGLGDSRDLDMSRPVDPEVLGIYAASTQNHQFLRTRAGHIGCLTWSPDGVYFCATEYPIDRSPGFELGLTTDEGVTATKVMHRASIEGMVQCPTGATATWLCEQDEWLPVCKDLGRCDFETGNYLDYPRGETCPPGPGGTGGTGGSGGDGYGATAGSGGLIDGGASGGNPADESLNIRGGCGTAAGPAGGLAALALFALSALGALSRKRRRWR
jgi:MYXO-CTERM domain-containing protein